MRLITIRNKDNEKLIQSYCDFTAPGGTIGRGANNTLVLPDLTRAISRLQATVDISSCGKAFVTHNGSIIPLILNGTELAYNVQHPLNEGDILSIGDYQFRVNLQEIVASSPPSSAPNTPESSVYSINDAIWDELEAEFPSNLSHPNKLVHHDPEHPLFTNESDVNTSKDPLAMLTETSLASLQEYEETSVANSLFEHFEQNDPFSQHTIMKDTTPSVLQTPPSFSAIRGAVEKAPLSTSLQTQDIFLLQEEQLSSECPLKTSMIDEDDDNDLTDLFINNAVPLTSTMDSLATLIPETPAWSNELDRQISTKDAKPPHQQQQNPNQIVTEELLSNPIQENAHNTPLLETHNELSSFNNDLFQLEPKEQLEKNRSDMVHQHARMGVNPVIHQPFQSQKSTSQEKLQGELFNAFVAGLGLDDVPVKPEFSPEQLHLAGQLLSLFSQGTVALLSSRHILKQGIKAEMTMILEEGNNPFKLLPSGKTALMQIFSTPMPGFITPENAVRDAMIDLQAHQLGMIAGVRAIIAAMLQNFHPDTLVQQAKKQGYFSGKSLFKTNRKAILWDVLKVQYQKVANEVEDDFHTLFGESFLHAYDLEVRQYKASQSNEGSS